MSEFIVSARKYRPETFKSVVGQGGITKTLKNAIQNNHLGHAYLFCGPRGVGKTTCARIFAKSINCYNLSPDGEPCNNCESCKAFNESRSYNIHELDAASNNTVDGIRSLTEQVRIPPQIGRYSVYIIDEVHMLSLAAFNAFLKTLEEPPAHAIFILATTEKHKIIPTILSRCQIFDFNRIKIEDSVNYLKYIAESENISAEEEALHVIAQKAEGAMRDALSIFDQVVSYSGKSISYQGVIENLNILDFEYYFKLTGLFLKGDVSESLLIFDEVLSKGFDGHNFINGLASHFRELLVASDDSTRKLLEGSEGIRNRYIAQSKLCSPIFLFDALNVCNQVDIQYKSSQNQRLLIELALFRLSRLMDEKKNSGSEINEGKSSGNLREPQPVKPGNSEAGTKKTPTRPDQPDLQKKHENHAEPDIRSAPKRNVVTSSGISIKDALSGKTVHVQKKSETKQEKGLPPTENKDREGKAGNDTFSNEELKNSWDRYADKLQHEKPRLYTTLISRSPRQGKDFKVFTEFDNSSQLDDFNHSVKQFIQNHLRRELNNDSIVIETSIRTGERVGKRLYTPEDKFQYLAKKNPVLLKIKQDFNLDFT